MNESPTPKELQCRLVGQSLYKSKAQLRKERFERIKAQGLNMMDAWHIQDSAGMPVWQMYTGNKHQRGSAD